MMKRAPGCSSSLTYLNHGLTHGSAWPRDQLYYVYLETGSWPSVADSRGSDNSLLRGAPRHKWRSFLAPTQTYSQISPREVHSGVESCGPNTSGNAYSLQRSSLRTRPVFVSVSPRRTEHASLAVPAGSKWSHQLPIWVWHCHTCRTVANRGRGHELPPKIIVLAVQRRRARSILLCSYCGGLTPLTARLSMATNAEASPLAARGRTLDT